MKRSLLQVAVEEAIPAHVKALKAERDELLAWKASAIEQHVRWLNWGEWLLNKYGRARPGASIFDEVVKLVAELVSEKEKSDGE